MENLRLITTETIQNCIACFEETGDKVSCCNASICETCYLEWLKTKRQCMHCKADQCDFDLWVEKYRVDSEEEYNLPASFGNVLEDIEQSLQFIQAAASADNDTYTVDLSFEVGPPDSNEEPIYNQLRTAIQNYINGEPQEVAPPNCNQQ